MHAPRIPASDFDYFLPSGRIATTPADPPLSAKLLVENLNIQKCIHSKMGDLGKFLNANDLLIVNETKVRNARIIGARAGSGGRVEGLVTDVVFEGWWALLQSNGRLHIGSEIVFNNAGFSQRVILEKKLQGLFFLKFLENSDAEEILNKVGYVPLPPYIRRARKEAGLPENVSEDKKWYQTSFAKGFPRSVAAPTAGFHLQADLREELKLKGVAFAKVSLEVGVGTFQPIKTEFVDQHVMHQENWEVPLETMEKIDQARVNKGRVIAVGTTAVRALESMKWISGKTKPRKGEKGRTDLMIQPGYDFLNVDGVLTNFHLPKSTLLALVSAFVGDRWRCLYNEAIENNYRFYSYGDAMLLIPF